MFEFHITTKAQCIDQLTDQLNLLGAAAVTWKDAKDQPIYELLPDEIIAWDDTILVALFDNAEHINFINQFLQQSSLLKSFDLREVPKKDWIRESLDQFQPQCFGNRLWICPSWITPPVPDAINVILDPGLAFGTGTHPTTAMCLRWLDANIKGNEIIIDYGCGSGILGIAAIKLGAKFVYAVDHDAQALEACQSNAALNHIAKHNLLIDTNVTHAADIVLANILAKTIIEFKNKFIKLTRPNGILLLSGILNSQKAEVIAVYQDYFNLMEETQEVDWMCLALQRKDIACDENNF